MPLERQSIRTSLFSVRARPGLLLLLALIAASGCSRMAFVKPDTSRRGYERVAPEVHVRKTKPDTAYEALEQAQLADLRLREGEYAKAEAAAKDALRRSPQLVDAMTLLAVAQERQGRSDAAGATYRRAAEQAPSRGDLLNNYGAWLCRQGRRAESLGWFERAWNAPGYATPDTALANSGACALQLGDTERARRDLRQAVTIAPENPVALGALAEAELRAGNLLEARAFSQRRLAAAPADVRSLQIASQIEQKLGDSDAAARYVQRMRKEFPESGNSREGEIEGP